MKCMLTLIVFTGLKLNVGSLLIFTSRLHFKGSVDGNGHFQVNRDML